MITGRRGGGRGGGYLFLTTVRVSVCVRFVMWFVVVSKE